MNPNFILEADHVTPLNEAQINACIDIIKAWNEIDQQLSDSVYISETFHGHVANIDLQNACATSSCRLYPNQLALAMRLNLRWISVSETKISFGLAR